MDIMDVLLRMDIPNPPERECRMDRLSQLSGQDVIFKFKALTYSRVAEVKEVAKKEMDVHTILAGVISPDFKNKELAEKYGAATPIELIKKLLLPGEIAVLSEAIQTLSGYNTVVMQDIDEIKKKSTKTSKQA